MSQSSQDHDEMKDTRYSTYTSVLIGGALAGMLVTTIVHPLDLIKVRMQLYPGVVTTEDMARKILRCEGVSALYKGLSAAYLRHFTYTTTRLAIYYGVYEKYTQTYGEIPGLTEKVNIGLYSSLIGGLTGNPSEVALIRMMTDGRKDPCCVRECRKLYKGAFHALYKITTTEGFWSLWRGGTLTLSRAACISVIQIGSYAQARVMLQEIAPEEDAKMHTYASFMSGFLTAIFTLPIDTMKTNYQIRTDNMSAKDVFLETLRANGLSYFWQGFFPYFMRLSIHTTFTYFVLREIRGLFRIMGIFEPEKRGPSCINNVQ